MNNKTINALSGYLTQKADKSTVDCQR